MRVIMLGLMGPVCFLALSWALCLGHATEEPTEAASAAGAKDDPVLATVEGHPIRQSDVDQLYVQAGVTPKDVPKERAIEELIRRESIRQFILASDIKIDGSAVDARWEQFKKQITEAGMSVQQVLEQYHLTEDEYKEALFIQMALDKLAEARVTQAELDGLQEEVRASHILIRVPEGASQAEWQQAEKMIVFIKQEIDNGQPFEECARAYSDDVTKTRGGDLGFFPRKGVMVEAFAKAAYALKVGEVSDPVKTQYGYHLIKVTDRSKEPAKQRLIAAKRAQIIDEISKAVEVKRFYKSESSEEEKPPEDTDDSSSQDNQ